MTKLDEARDALNRAEKSIGAGNGFLPNATGNVIDAVRLLVDEFAKLSPAPVGEDADFPCKGPVYIRLRLATTDGLPSDRQPPLPEKPRGEG